MAIETALVFDLDGNPLFWHLPPGRSGGWIPDSRDLWGVLWEHRECLGGVAHTHPWSGSAVPSRTDVTTFRAVEKGLGKLLMWPVVTFTEVVVYAYNEGTGEYVPIDVEVMLTNAFWESVERLCGLTENEDG